MRCASPASRSSVRSDSKADPPLELPPGTAVPERNYESLYEMVERWVRRLLRLPPRKFPYG